jgi:hypothetical protein
MLKKPKKIKKKKKKKKKKKHHRHLVFFFLNFFFFIFLFSCFMNKDNLEEKQRKGHGVSCMVGRLSINE